jgi:hypothetical protein
MCNFTNDLNIRLISGLIGRSDHPDVMPVVGELIAVIHSSFSGVDVFDQQTIDKAVASFHSRAQKLIVGYNPAWVEHCVAETVEKARVTGRRAGSRQKRQGFLSRIIGKIFSAAGII